MPISTLAERALRIREAAGYGDERQAAEFARLLGIKPPSLHDIESGKTTTLREKSIRGYLRIGANLEFLLTGKGDPMRKSEIERRLRDETLVSMIEDLTEDNKTRIVDVIRALIRAQPGTSKNDPFKRDPPESGS
jgi:transcriptional regulator with XRE-family HTH domain